MYAVLSACDLQQSNILNSTQLRHFVPSKLLACLYNNRPDIWKSVLEDKPYCKNVGASLKDYPVIEAHMTNPFKELRAFPVWPTEDDGEEDAEEDDES